MSQRSVTAAPPCYAMTLPGLEVVAADEIAHSLDGEVKRTGYQVVRTTRSATRRALSAAPIVAVGATRRSVGSRAAQPALGED